MSVNGGEGNISGTRMLERRVSNNRADLSGDQRMNYFLAWFNQWSELQKSDFVKVLSDKMNGGSMPPMVNGDACNEFDSLNINGADHNKKPPSLFTCQVKLFREWFSGWSDDQKNYLVMRLQAIDAEFYAKYEKYASDPDAAARGLVKDYFEPGVPPEMVRKSSRSVLGTNSISPTPPAVGYTSNNFSSVSSIESARPATIDEGPDSVFTEDSCLTDELKTGYVKREDLDSHIDSDSELQEKNNYCDTVKDENIDMNCQKQLSTIAE